MVITARIAAFLALDTFFLEGVFIEESLDRFKGGLSSVDFGLAYELAAGVIRQKKALELSVLKQGAMPKKRKEKILVFMALYQQLYLDRIPDFAIGSEMVSLAKRYASEPFAKFLNAFIRNNRCVKDESALSYTDYFVTRLKAVYGDDLALEILQCGDTKPPLFARDRTAMKMEQRDAYIESDRYYFQNPTQFIIYSELKKHIKHIPDLILDLAASPGGKLLLLHDFFPDATLYANDISERRVERIRENCKKYGLEAALTVSDGNEFEAECAFDLVVLDAPCSNSGCLYKCPEARWRLTKENISAHVELQKRLLQKAFTLIKPNGYVIYSTCSVLPEENEELVATFTPLASCRVLPNSAGLEGGFGTILNMP